uniref:Transmembrane protein n=1 Tax=Solanum tuberosum TaxID=4113 RepID=M1DX17_SOLTU
MLCWLLFPRTVVVVRAKSLLEMEFGARVVELLFGQTFWLLFVAGLLVVRATVWRFSNVCLEMISGEVLWVKPAGGWLVAMVRVNRVVFGLNLVEKVEKEDGSFGQLSCWLVAAKKMEKMRGFGSDFTGGFGWLFLVIFC